MNQPDLFAADNPPRASGYRPDPDRVRARLERILSQARAAETLPWEPTRISLYRIIVPDMSRWLPDEEAARWRSDIEAELARLEAAA